MKFIRNNSISKFIFLFLLLFITSVHSAAIAGDATSFDPTAVAVEAKAASDTPIGGIIPFGSSAIPDGWLECNGQSTAGYPELAAIYGATVPDLRGQFIRGHDAGKGIDSGRALLSNQNDAMESHSHTTTISISGSVNVPMAGGFNSWGFRTGPGYSTYGVGFSGSGSGTSTSAGSGSENRPVNMAFKYIIKAQ